MKKDKPAQPVAEEDEFDDDADALEALVTNETEEKAPKAESKTESKAESKENNPPAPDETISA